MKVRIYILQTELLLSGFYHFNVVSIRLILDVLLRLNSTEVCVFRAGIFQCFSSLFLHDVRISIWASLVPWFQSFVCGTVSRPQSDFRKILYASLEQYM